MAYLVILNNESDAGEKVMAVAPFEGLNEAKEILFDWAEMCIENLVEKIDIPWAEYDFHGLVEILYEYFDVSVEVVDGM